MARAGHLLPLLALLLTSSAYSYEQTNYNGNFTTSVISKPCRDGCTERGNCNAETGLCECPWGLTGPTCAEEALPACRPQPGAQASCGTFIPKSCECYRQCTQLYCQAQGSTDPGKCMHQVVWGLKDTACYNYTARPAQEQRSEVPGPSDNVVWQRAFSVFGAAVGEVEPLDPTRAFKTQYGDTVVLPSTQCPKACSGRGWCVMDSAAGAQPRCHCRHGYSGPGCTALDAQASCWFAPECSGRGVCKAGFCHCNKGFWGLGCARSTAYAPRPGGHAVPVLSRLRIYMYELPWHVSSPYEAGDAQGGRDAIYTATELFLHKFLADTQVRTEDPWEANLFFIPLLPLMYAGNVGPVQGVYTHVVRHIAATYPFYNRTGGRDHFFWLPGDRGPCALPGDVQGPEIKIVHFGMAGPGVAETCISPSRDIVAPPVVYQQLLMDALQRDVYKAIITNNGSDPNRKLLFFFAGSLSSGDPRYSGGARQALGALLSQAGFKEKNPDVLVADGKVDNYEELHATSKFCLAPYGWGWGVRISNAMLYGCVPVIVQDGVWQPFEDMLPYQNFSVRIRIKDIPRIVDVLRAHSEEQLAAMRLAMARHYRAFLWQDYMGGQAYNTTLRALHRRMVALHLGAYRRKQLRSSSRRRGLS